MVGPPRLRARSLRAVYLVVWQDDPIAALERRQGLCEL